MKLEEEERISVQLLLKCCAGLGNNIGAYMEVSSMANLGQIAKQCMSNVDFVLLL